MKSLGAIVPFLLVASAVSSPAQVVSEPKFQVAIQASADDSPKFSVTNLSAKTLTGCVIELSVSTQTRPQGQVVWDSLVQESWVGKRGAQGPLEPGQTLTLFLGHKVGGPLPDKVEIVAGIWADGETFGQSSWINLLIANRDSTASEYEEIIGLLREGIENGWTREQYLAAVEDKRNSGTVSAVRSTFLANPQLERQPQLAKRIAQGLLDQFEQRLHLLRPQKTGGQDVSTP